MLGLNISVSNLSSKTGDNNQRESEVEYELTSKKAHHHSLNKNDVEVECHRYKMLKIFANFDSSYYFLLNCHSGLNIVEEITYIMERNTTFLSE
jgi:hypothetical protein